MSGLTLTLQPIWEDDLRFPFIRSSQGANQKPDFDTDNVGLLFPQNDETEIVSIVAQLPHGYKEGTTIFPHVHIVQSQNAQAKFVMQYKWYNPVGDSIPASWSTYIMDTYMDNTAYTTPRSNLIRGTGGIVGTGKEYSSILKIKLYRQTGDGYTGDVLTDEFDIHFYSDKQGTKP